MNQETLIYIADGPMESLSSQERVSILANVLGDQDCSHLTLSDRGRVFLTRQGSGYSVCKDDGPHTTQTVFAIPHDGEYEQEFPLVMPAQPPFAVGSTRTLDSLLAAIAQVSLLERNSKEDLGRFSPQM